MLAQGEVAQAPGVRCCVALMRRDDVCPIPFPQLKHITAQTQRLALVSQPNMATMVVHLHRRSHSEPTEGIGKLHHRDDWCNAGHKTMIPAG